MSLMDRRKDGTFPILLRTELFHRKEIVYIPKYYKYILSILMGVAILTLIKL